MTELECKESIKKRMQGICQRHEDLEPLDEDERYIFMSIEYLNVHESLGRNIHEFLDLADNVGLFNHSEEEKEIAELKGRIKNLEAQLKIYESAFKWVEA